MGIGLEDFSIITNINIMLMCSLLKKEIEKHLSLYGVVYVIEPTGALILADGRSCTVSDYKVIPETVHIKNGAFLNCTIIESVDMSTAQVNSIGSLAFFGCENLKAIHFSEYIENIGEWAFNRCRLKKMDLPAGLKNIGAGAFAINAEIEEVIIPDGVTRIDNLTFQYCSGLARIYIPPSISSIGKYAFWQSNSLKTIFVKRGYERRIKYRLPWGLKGKVKPL